MCRHAAKAIAANSVRYSPNETSSAVETGVGTRSVGLAAAAAFCVASWYDFLDHALAVTAIFALAPTIGGTAPPLLGHYLGTVLTHDQDLRWDRWEF